jgi:hypothetical protein
VPLYEASAVAEFQTWNYCMLVVYKVRVECGFPLPHIGICIAMGSCACATEQIPNSCGFCPLPMTQIPNKTAYRLQKARIKAYTCAKSTTGLI